MPNNNIITGIIAVLAGILVLAWNDALQWIVGVFLLVWGMMQIISRR